MAVKGLILPKLIWLWTCSIPTSHILGVQSVCLCRQFLGNFHSHSGTKPLVNLKHRKHTRNLPYWLWQDYRLLALAQFFEPHQALNWGFAFPWGWFVLESPSKWVEWGGSVWPHGTKSLVPNCSGGLLNSLHVWPCFLESSLRCTPSFFIRFSKCP